MLREKDEILRKCSNEGEGGRIRKHWIIFSPTYPSEKRIPNGVSIKFLFSMTMVKKHEFSQWLSSFTWRIFMSLLSHVWEWKFSDIGERLYFTPIVIILTNWLAWEQKHSNTNFSSINYPAINFIVVLNGNSPRQLENPNAIPHLLNMNGFMLTSSSNHILMLFFCSDFGTLWVILCPCHNRAMELTIYVGCEIRKGPLKEILSHLPIHS